MKKLILFTLILFYSGLCLSQPKSKFSPQGYIESVIKKDPNYKNAVVAIYAEDGDGKVIADWNSDMPLLTASTLKTITTGLSLIYLGADYKFETKVAYSGEIKGDVLYGNLYIIGGGDPTLGSSEEIAFPIDSIFGVWAKELYDKGVRRIEGDIIVDDSFLEREVIPSSWTWGNIGYYYGTAPSGLPFHEDIQQVKYVPGKKPGDKVKIIVSYPQIPNFEYVNNLVTGERDSGDWSEYVSSDLARIGKFTGSLPCGRDTIKTTISNKFAYLSCGLAFREFLISKGFIVGDRIMSIDQLPERENIIDLVKTYSPELYKIVDVTNKISNNFYAETLFKTMAKIATGVGSYKAAVETANKILDSLNIDRWGYTQDDGSGLSRENYVSPKFFVRFYDALSKYQIFEKYLESFPYPGVGTFKYVLTSKQFNPNIANRVHAKSGSLSCVKTYAGYVTGGQKSGLIKFAILVNNYACPTKDIQRHLEGFMYSLASME